MFATILLHFFDWCRFFFICILFFVFCFAPKRTTRVRFLYQNQIQIYLRNAEIMQVHYI